MRPKGLGPREMAGFLGATRVTDQSEDVHNCYSSSPTPMLKLNHEMKNAARDVGKNSQEYRLLRNLMGWIERGRIDDPLYRDTELRFCLSGFLPCSSLLSFFSLIFCCLVFNERFHLRLGVSLNLDSLRQWRTLTTQ